MSSTLILLVEDNPADARLTIEAFKRENGRWTIELCEDGESALARLRDASRPLPSLVLLDLNLPGLHGREVLDAIKTDPRLRSIPVCILTTSRATDDISLAYSHLSNCYVVKPVDLHAFRTTVQQIKEFWFSTARIPDPPAATR
jgi:CheY-like chemotaxis protein